MLQPRKDVLREQLVLAAEEIIALRGTAEGARAWYVFHIAEQEKKIIALRDHRWWHRFAWWRK